MHFVLLFVGVVCALVVVGSVWRGGVAGLRVWGFLWVCGIFSVCESWGGGVLRSL